MFSELATELMLGLTGGLKHQIQWMRLEEVHLSRLERLLESLDGGEGGDIGS